MVYTFWVQNIGDVQAILPFPPNGSIAWTSAVSHVGRTSNAFRVSMKLQTFLFQMVVTSRISVQYLWKYGFAKSSDNLYAPCTMEFTIVMSIHTVVCLTGEASAASVAGESFCGVCEPPAAYNNCQRHSWPWPWYSACTETQQYYSLFSR